MDLFLSNNQILREVRENESKQNPNGPFIANSQKDEVKGQDTRLDEKQDPILFSFLRPNPESFESQEISFEKNFLAQHITTVDQLFQKSKESIPAVPNSSPSHTFLPPQLTSHTEINSNSTSSFIKSRVASCQQMSHDQFIKDLKKQKDLDQFLKYLIGKYDSSLVAEVILLTIEVWSEVRSLNLKEFEMRDFRTIAANFIRKKAQGYLQRTGFLRLKRLALQAQAVEKANDLKQNFKDLVQRYATTVLLIVGGFFANPYVTGEDPLEEEDQVDYPKRQFSSVSIGFMSYQDIFSESQFSVGPEKKIKPQ